jgi:hypothetical protein
MVTAYALTMANYEKSDCDGWMENAQRLPTKRSVCTQAGEN